MAFHIFTDIIFTETALASLSLVLNRHFISLGLLLDSNLSLPDDLESHPTTIHQEAGFEPTKIARTFRS
jgi:hypothetical protein